MTDELQSDLERVEECRYYRRYGWWQDAVGSFLIGTVLLAFAGCFASRVAGQGILKKPVVETMKVPEWLWPHVEVPKHVGPPKEAAKLVDLPDWIFFPEVEVPKHVGSGTVKVAQKTELSVLFHLVPPKGWDDPEYWIAYQPHLLPDGKVTNNDGIPPFFAGFGWYRIGKVTEYRTKDYSQPGRQVTFLLAVSNEDGSWKSLKLVGTVGGERVADFRESSQWSVLTEMTK